MNVVVSPCCQMVETTPVSAVSRAEKIPADTAPFAVIVAGPTASGKSALALALAERLSMDDRA